MQRHIAGIMHTDLNDVMTPFNNSKFELTAASLQKMDSKPFILYLHLYLTVSFREANKIGGIKQEVL